MVILTATPSQILRTHREHLTNVFQNYATTHEILLTWGLFSKEGDNCYTQFYAVQWPVFLFLRSYLAWNSCTATKSLRCGFSARRCWKSSARVPVGATSSRFPIWLVELVDFSEEMWREVRWSYCHRCFLRTDSAWERTPVVRRFYRKNLFPMY